MTQKTEQLKKTLEQRQQEKRDKAVAELQAAKIAVQLAGFFDTLGNILIDLKRKSGDLEAAIKALPPVVFPKTQKVNGEVEITNLPHVQPVQVTNPPDGKVEVVNQIDLEPLRDDLNEVLTMLDNVITQNDDVNSNRFFELRDFLKGLALVISKQDQSILEALKPLQFLSDKPTKPIAVRLSDGEKWMRQLVAVVKQMEQQVVTAGGALGATITGSGLATEATLAQVRDAVDGLEGFTDGIEALLAAIRDNADQLEGFTDGLEGLLTTIRDNADTVEAKLQSIIDNTDGLEGFTDGIEGLLTQIRDFVDTLENLVALISAYGTFTTNALNVQSQSIEAKLQTIINSLSQVNEDLWQKETFNGKGFAIATGIMVIASSLETDFVLFRNTTGSGKLVRIKEFLLTLAETGGSTATVRFYRNPTIVSVGTALTVSKVRPSQTQTTAVNVYTLPVISARGSLIQEIRLNGGQTFTRDTNLARYVEDGKDLLITFDSSGNNKSFGLTGAWLEV